jgi:uncharacterized membrane protein YfcA
MFTLVILFVLSFLAATISGSAGFGGALLLLPLLNNFVGIKAAVPILTVAQLLGNISRAEFGFPEIRWRSAGLFILGALPATFIGAKLFIVLPKQSINIGIGVLLIGIVIMRRLKLFELGRKTNQVLHSQFCACGTGMNVRVKEIALVPGGVLVGFLSAVAGSAGPLGAAIFLGLNLPATAYVASEAVTAVAMHLTKIILYNKFSLIGFSELLLGGFLGVAMIIGSWLGKKIIQKLSRDKFLIFVEILLVVSGVQLIFTS